MPKIAAISIENFRGIIGDFTLDLSNNGRVTSVFLLGDNGCGKSSVLDAIAFCLRGEPVRPGESGYGQPHLKNYNKPADSPSSVAIQLDSGEEVVRLVTQTERGHRQVPPNESFRYSRFVIRRRDLLEFMELSTAQRSSYLARFGGAPLLAEKTSELQGVHNELSALSKRKSSLEEAVIAKTESDKDHFPRNSTTLDEWVYKYRGGTPSLTRAQRRELPHLPPDLAEDVDELRAVHSSIRKLRKHAHSLGTGRKKNAINAQLEIVGKNVTAAFLKLCPQNVLVKRFVFLAPEETSQAVVSLRMDLPSGHNVTPSSVLSEASLDLLALLTFLYLIKASASFGQGKVIVLDDVFSSVDSTVRNRIAEHLFTEFHDWQLILSFHDRLWFEQFRRAASSKGFGYLAYEFGVWRPESGPVIYQAPQDSSTSLRNAMAASALDRMLIAGLAGLLVETISDFLSLNLALPLPRRLNQSYNIGEMWPAISKVLDRSTIAKYASDIDGMVHLRNFGAHHTEWATNLSIVEVLDFAEATLALWEHVYCPVCRAYLKRKGGGLQCTCGRLSATLS